MNSWILKLRGFFFLLIRVGVDLLLHTTGALMAFVTLQKIADRMNWKEKRWFLFISKNSMGIYLFHQQIVYVCIYLFNGVINPYVHAAINFISAIMISIIISTILMRYRYLRFLIGEK